MVKNKTTVIVVEDNIVYCEFVCNMLAREGYRKAVIKKYLLMFKVDEDTKTVVVYRVFYGAMDYEKML